MDWVVETHTAEALLIQFFEWFDCEEILLAATHKDLVRKFIAQRNPQARPKVVA